MTAWTFRFYSNRPAIRRRDFSSYIFPRSLEECNQEFKLLILAQREEVLLLKVQVPLVCYWIISMVVLKDDHRG